jgi:hypothetical protein
MNNNGRLAIANAATAESFDSTAIRPACAAIADKREDGNGRQP